MKRESALDNDWSELIRDDEAVSVGKSEELMGDNDIRYRLDFRRGECEIGMDER